MYPISNSFINENKDIVYSIRCLSQIDSLSSHGIQKNTRKYAFDCSETDHPQHHKSENIETTNVRIDCSILVEIHSHCRTQKSISNHLFLEMFDKLVEFKSKIFLLLSMFYSVPQWAKHLVTEHYSLYYFVPSMSNELFVQLYPNSKYPIQ